MSQSLQEIRGHTLEVRVNRKQLAAKTKWDSKLTDYNSLTVVLEELFDHRFLHKLLKEE